MQNGATHEQNPLLDMYMDLLLLAQPLAFSQNNQGCIQKGF